MQKINGKLKKEFIIIVFLFFFALSSKLITLWYPIPSDSIVFADIAEKFHDNSYVSGISESSLTKVPPLYPLIASVFMYFTNAPDAIRILSILSSSLTILIIYLFARIMKLSKFVSILAALLVLFNPWYFYYTATLPLTESLSVFFVLLAFLLYYLKYRYLAAIFFSLAVITRYTNALFVVPICFLYLIDIFHHYKSRKLRGFNGMYHKIKTLLIFSLIVFSPFVLWTCFNTYNQVNIQDTDYIGHIENNPNKGLAIIPVFFNVLVEYIFKALPIMFIFLLPLIIINYFIISNYKKYSNFQKYKLTNQERKFWNVIFIAFILHLLFYTWWVAIMVDQFFPLVWEKIRYLVLFVPLFTLMAVRFDLRIFVFNFYKKINYKIKKIYNFIFDRKILSVLILLIFIFLSGFVNFGFVKDQVDKVIPSNSIYAQRSWHQHQVISLFDDYLDEQNIHDDIVVIGVLSHESELGHINYYMGDYLNFGTVKIDYIALNTKDKLTKKELNLTIEENVNYFNDKLVFIFSEFNEEDTVDRLREYSLIEDIKINKIMQNNNLPHVYIFEVAWLNINNNS
ncbi:MAG: glycosyltransferase family 39 protein [Candidatus Woesearchaeota archaeon]